mgnify:CR=1 FL=1
MESANNSRSCETTLKSPSKRCTKQPSLSQTVYHGHRRTRWGCWLGAGFLLAAMTPSWSADTDLGSIGKTRLQKNTGNAVQKTCGGFVEEWVASETIPGDSGSRDPSLSPAAIPLFATCGAMVQTANEILENGERTDASLGTDADETAASLQQIATEEYAAAGQMATEVGSNRINIGINRLIEVRRGARGFSIAGISPDS